MKHFLVPLFLAGALSALAACGGPTRPPAAPDPATTALNALLRAGTVMPGVPSKSPAVITSLSVTPDGRRIALLYGDGHVVVWDVLHHEELLTVPPQRSPLEPPQVWLTGDGNMLALATNVVPVSDDTVQLWAVGHPGQDNHFTLSTDWIWMDAALSRILIIPNFTETCPTGESPCHGIPGLLWYDFRHSRLLASAPSPPSAPAAAPNGKLDAQPPNLVPTDVEFDGGTFAIASTAQDGFVTWKPGNAPAATNAQCETEGALSGNGQLFACISVQAGALALWNVPQRRMIRQMLLPDYIANNQQTAIQSVIFADDGSELAVAIGRQGRPDIVRIYNVSNFQLARTLTLSKAANQFDTVTLWSAGRSLIAHEQTGTATGIYYAFSLGA
jgi:WD40 repeat protein